MSAFELHNIPIEIKFVNSHKLAVHLLYQLRVLIRLCLQLEKSQPFFMFFLTADIDRSKDLYARRMIAGEEA